MRYLVTGHTGFKGAWLSLLLTHRGDEVYGLALDPAAGGIFERADISRLLAGDVRGDIRNADLVRRVVEDARPDVVMHLAAQPLVRESLRDPRRTFETNVLGTLNMLEAVVESDGVRAHVVVTTDKVYRNTGKPKGYVEDDPLGGEDPYSASKAMVELLTASIVARGGSCPTATVRAGNVVGGGDVSPDRLVPDLIRAHDAGVTPVLRYPESVRPWQHVLDVLCGYLAVVEELVHGRGQEPWNFGPSGVDGVTVADVAERIGRMFGTDPPWAKDPSPQPQEAAVLTLDSEKARSVLGWRPRLGIDEALSWTVDWYRLADAMGARAAATTQIDGFADLVRAVTSE